MMKIISLQRFRCGFANTELEKPPEVTVEALIAMSNELAEQQKRANIREMIRRLEMRILWIMA